MADVGRVANPAHRQRFAAFISYSHADAAYAGKLQSRLERYRLPKHIAAAHAEGQAALGQIFRDREDLAAAPSLSDAIRAAIGEAEALIVICSPDARASHWVGEEIALFRSLHPDRPILAALIRGEPEQSFPAALTKDGNEPLAADLRKEADGQTLGFLKIVAGIAGVPLDALVQRDAQRRVRRVMWITGAALAAMLVMGVMTTLAVQARNEAARQRAEAEGLVEYMLTDLREKLKGVGRLDVMSAVNARAMNYYTSQDFERLPPDSLARRARIIEAMGADDEAARRVDDALTKYRKVHGITSALLSDQPRNAQRILDHANSENRIGLLHFSDGDPAIALPFFQRARHLIHTAKPDNRSAKQWNKLASYVETNLCGALLKLGNQQVKALNHCSIALNLSEKYFDKYPNDATAFYDHILDHSWLAEAYATNAKHVLAQEMLGKSLTLVNRLVDTDRSNAMWLELKLQIIIQYLNVSKKYNYDVDFINLKKQAYEISLYLKNNDPKNTYWFQKFEEIKSILEDK